MYCLFYSYPYRRHIDAFLSQTPPAVDIMLLLTTAVECGRISFTIPWMVEYLAMMDTAACKLNYYQTVFRKLVNLHRYEKFQLTIVLCAKIN